MGIYIGMVISMLLSEDGKDCRMCPDEDTDKCKTCDKG